MDWRVKLESEDNTMVQLRDSAYNKPTAMIVRDGISWFLESTDFDGIRDHAVIKDKASQIIQAMHSQAPGATIGMGDMYRFHYDGSKTVYKAEN